MGISHYWRNGNAWAWMVNWPELVEDSRDIMSTRWLKPYSQIESQGQGANEQMIYIDVYETFVLQKTLKSFDCCKTGYSDDIDMTTIMMRGSALSGDGIRISSDTDWDDEWVNCKRVYQRLWPGISTWYASKNVDSGLPKSFRETFLKSSFATPWEEQRSPVRIYDAAKQPCVQVSKLGSKTELVALILHKGSQTQLDGKSRKLDPSCFPSRQWSLPNLGLDDKDIEILVDGIIGSKLPWIAHDIDLNGNQIGDEGFITLCDQLSISLSSEPESEDEDGVTKTKPYLQRLYLQQNAIKLKSPTIASFFASQKFTQLHTLSLSGNPLDNDTFVNLFSNFSLTSSCFRNLRVLEISRCGLKLKAADALVTWLGNHRAETSSLTSSSSSLPSSSSLSNLIIFRANQNLWGTIGSDRIITSLSKRGGNTTLLMVELSIIDEKTNLPQRPDSSLSILNRCLVRNRELRLVTRRAGWGILAPARVIFHGKSSNSSGDDGRKLKQSLLERLPIEIWKEVFRWVGRWAAIAGCCESNGDRSKPKVKSVLELKKKQEAIKHNNLRLDAGLDLLTDGQIFNILKYAANRGSLKDERELIENEQARRTNTNDAKSNEEDDEKDDKGCLKIKNPQTYAVYLGGIWSATTDERAGGKTWMQKVIGRMGCEKFEGVIPELV